MRPTHPRSRDLGGIIIALLALLLFPTTSHAVASNTAISQFANDTNASASATNPTTLTSGQPRFSWVNDFASSVTRQRVQVVTTPLTNVVALWHLDRATVLADSAASHTLVASGAPVDAAAKNTAFGRSRTFGAGKWYSTPSAADLSMTTNFTVEAWFRATGPLAAFKSIVSKQQQASPWGTNYRLGMDGSGTNLEFFFTKGGMTTTVNPGVAAAPYLDGAWHHIAGTYDGANAVLYIDGVQRATVASAGAADTYAAPLVIGNSVNFSADEWPGDVDEVRVSSTPRSGAEIAAYYATQLPHFTELWDSDPADTGSVTLAASCGASGRCADIAYDSSGPSALSLLPGGRYFARAKFKPTASPFNVFGAWDWFQMSATALLAPTTLFTANGTASAGATNPTTISSASPRFSLLNATGATATSQRVRVMNDIVDSNVLGLWHMDSTTGTTLDSSAYASSTATSGTVTNPAGNTGFGTAMSIAGAGELTATGVPVDRTAGAATTVDFWMKWDGTYDVIPIGWGAGGANTDLWIDSAGHFGFCSENNSEVLGVPKAVTDTLANRWVHIAAVFVNGAPASNQLYIDGVLQTLTLFGGPITPGNAYVNSTFQMGGGGNGNGWRWSGQLDDVRITNGTRTATEVSQYFATSAPHGTVMWDSDPADGGVALASCTSGTRCADITYAGSALRQPGARYYVTAKYKGAAGTWSPWSAPDWFVTSTNAPPGSPTVPTQFRADGTTAIAGGASTSDGATTNVVLKFSAADADVGQTFTPWVEVRPNATAFSATCGATVAGATFSGTPVSAPAAATSYPLAVNVSGLAPATAYHWRACVVDQNGATSTWVSRGGSPDFQVSSLLTITLDSPSVTLGSGLYALADGASTSTVTVTTNALNGYTLSATDEDDAWAARTASNDQVLDYAAPCTAPTAWAAGTAGGFGVTVLGATGGATSRLAAWGPGTNIAATDYVNNRYCGLDLGTSSTLHVRTGPYAGSDTVSVGYRVNVAAAQRAGSYSGVISYSVVANP